MIEQDTIKLLRECDAGVKMGTASIGDVLDSVQAEGLRRCLTDCMTKHQKLGHQIEHLLDRYQDDGKDPSRIAQTMSRVKTNMKLAMHESDASIASLMTDGCNMGVKSLSQYLNQYGAADEASKNIAKRLIHLEENLAADMRPFL